MQGDRWVEVSPSNFDHEREGLQIVKNLLPDAAPYRAWSNFEFRDTNGRWHEVDLLVLTRDGLYLIELKHFYGTIGGDDYRWTRSHGKPLQSPLLLARRKSQYLATRLQNKLHEVSKGKAPKSTIPFIQELVFLHHPDTICELPPSSRINLYGLDGHDADTGLPGISKILLAPASGQPISEHNSDLINGLMTKLGIQAPRRAREVGNWKLTDEALGDGEGWQDWPAKHAVDDKRIARIRFYPPVPGASAAEQDKRHRAVTHGFRLLNRLKHDGLQVPIELVQDGELGVGWVFDEPKDYVRLDLWLVEKKLALSLERQLELLNRIATVVQYAHRHRVVHRGLNPQAVLVKERGERLLPFVSNWDTAGILQPGSSDPGLSGLPASPLSGLVGDNIEIAKLYAAPEGRTATEPARMDVFGLGILAFYLVTGGSAPAADRGELMARLRRSNGLDVSAELPQVPSPLRNLILDATHRSPSERLSTVAEFLERLDAVRAELVGVPGRTDPLEAGPGDILDGRFVYKQRLGAGSTAVAILVTDEQAASAQRVLKVAKDESAAARLSAEAQLLAKVEHDRIVHLMHQIEVGKRNTLVLGFAGATTLAEELSAKGRLSINLLERWGTDLLSAVRGLEQAGVAHRDIKPANLGVSSHKSESHLTLFDFSMAGVDAKDIEAGTPPYLDPFLGMDGRKQYDSAAERYGAAVVLYEMATGTIPQYGSDPDENAASSNDDVTIDPALFEQALAPALGEFFAAALSRDVTRRPGTAEEMLRAWRQVFTDLDSAPTIVDTDAAQKVSETTLLMASGLSVRAVSAMAALHVATVGELLALDTTKLNRLLSKEAITTRKEVVARYKQWKDQLGARKRPSRNELPGLAEAVTLLLDAVGRGKRTRRTAQGSESRGATDRKSTRRQAAELILGTTGRLDAFASSTELAEALSMTPARGSQLLKELQEDWGGGTETAGLLDDVVAVVTRVIDEFGGVAAVDMLTDEVRAMLPEPPDTDEYVAARAAAGLVRVAFDRLSEHEQLDDARKLARRRHSGRLTLVAKDEKLLAAAERAGRRADELTRDEPEGVISPAVAARELRDAYLQEYRNAEPGATVSPPPDDRLIRLASAASRQAAISGRGELHSKFIAPKAMIRIALAGLSQSESLSTTELRQRVAARFPKPDRLPMRTALDSMVAAADLGLIYDESAKVYRFRDAEPPSVTRLPTQRPTTGVSVPVPDTEPTWSGYAATTQATILRRSVDGYGFLAIGVPIRRADDHTRAARRLAERYGGDIIDLAGELVAAIREFTDGKVPWPEVLTADAADAAPRAAQGLRTVVGRVAPAVLDRIDNAIFSEPNSGRPLIVTELSPLARYGFLQRVARWSDLTAPRRRPVWVILPELHQIRGPQVDGSPIQLGSPNGQFVEYRPGTDNPDTEKVMT